MWNEPRPPGAPKRGWRDWVLVGVLAALAVLEALVRPDLPWRAVSITVTLALIPTLLWRRTHPLLMLAIAFATTALAPLLTNGERAETFTLAYLLVLVYALFRWGSGREAIVGLAIMLASVLLSFTLDRLAASDAGGALAVTFAALALGTAFRYRAGARARELDQVKLREREQLARDLHDTVAHHVSAMAIRAQAGIATAASRPEAATEALHVIEAEAARALAEMNAMVRVLRQPAELAPGRTIADLKELAAGSGTPVDVRVSGAVDDLPLLVGAAVYRLAQESVTNARRHARQATRIEVDVTADAASVHLRVSDDGDPRQAASPGFGLLGMRERAILLGGTCEAGPNPNRGWTVTATLPLTRVAR